MSEREANSMRAEAREMFTLYHDTKDEENITWLICGDNGTGKTRCAMTCRQPVLIQLFDPGGARVGALQPLIDDGRIIVDNRWCQRIKNKFEIWQADMNTKFDSGFFDQFGTVFIDSLTFFGDAIVACVAKMVGRADGVLLPRGGKDYMVLKAVVTKMVNDLSYMPCDTVLTAHLRNIESGDGAVIGKLIDFPGSSRIKIQSMFDEILVTETKLLYDKDKGEQVEYSLLTRNTGRQIARTRIGDGIFDLHEKPDIMYLRKKAGKGVAHKPAIVITGEQL